jgi:hypothetical protein
LKHRNVQNKRVNRWLHINYEDICVALWQTLDRFF